MGAKFKLKHANIMAYLTSTSNEAPRILRADLSEFLETISYNSEQYFIAEYQSERWSNQIKDIANQALKKLHDSIEYCKDEALPRIIVKKVLEDLKFELSNFSLFALAVGKGKKLEKTAYRLARENMGHHFLILIPEEETSQRNFEVLDPIPAFSTALHSLSSWPGIVFWTTTGSSSFVSLNNINELWSELKQIFKPSQYDQSNYLPANGKKNLDLVLRQWNNNKQEKMRRVLHLSDLHFGTSDADKNQPILLAELNNIVKSVDRVVITGDLFDTPKEKYATLFNEFKNKITYLTKGSEPIVITGNHDQRMYGLIGSKYKEIASIGSTKIIVDNDCNMIFICFNSSEKGTFARGKITNNQLKRLSSEYESIVSSDPKFNNYLPVVLVHHHPFSFDVEPETWIQRALSKLNFGDEVFLEMVNAENLHKWCIERKIKTILHGHKHKARYIERQLMYNNNKVNLTAIGCGSSLGAEGSALSYNILEWDYNTKRWVASFYESVQGGEFKEIIVSVSP